MGMSPKTARLHKTIPRDSSAALAKQSLTSSRPQGIFDPNFRKVGDFFENMFVGIEADAAKWGCQSPTRSLQSLHTSPAAISLL